MQKCDLNCLFPHDYHLLTRDKVFKNFYDQYFVPVSVFTRRVTAVRGGGGGNHYHHIWPVKSCLTDFTQILPLVKCYISTPFGFWIYKRWMIHLSEVWLYTMYQVFKISWNLPIIITGSILVMGWVKYTRKGGDVKNGLKCEMDDGGVPSMASKAPTNHLFFPQAKPVTDYGNKQKSNKCGH